MDLSVFLEFDQKDLIDFPLEELDLFDWRRLTILYLQHLSLPIEAIESIDGVIIETGNGIVVHR